MDRVSTVTASLQSEYTDSGQTALKILIGKQTEIDRITIPNLNEHELYMLELFKNFMMDETEAEDEKEKIETMVTPKTTDGKTTKTEVSEEPQGDVIPQAEDAEDFTQQKKFGDAMSPRNFAPPPSQAAPPPPPPPSRTAPAPDTSPPVDGSETKTVLPLNLPLPLTLPLFFFLSTN